MAEIINEQNDSHGMMNKNIGDGPKLIDRTYEQIIDPRHIDNIDVKQNIEVLPLEPNVKIIAHSESCTSIMFNN